jgi:DeoR/GlpR family transcriptional regulator of sugar metabolism
MKRARDLVDNRRMMVLELLKRNGHVTVSDLADEFDVSPLTLRRDLQYLEDNKKIERFYGGAAIIPEAIDSQEDKVSHYRRLIAQYAASLVEDGDVIFINASSTALQMLPYIRDKRVTVITNHVQAIYTDHSPKVTIILTGGEIRERQEALVGEFAADTLEHITAKKSFLGCSGLSTKTGITTKHLNEVNINHLMLCRVNGPTYILADHTKIGKDSRFVSDSMKQLQHIITDELTNPLMIDALQDGGVQVHIVSGY